MYPQPRIGTPAHPHFLTSRSAMETSPYTAISGHAGRVNADPDVSAHKRQRKEEAGMEPKGHGNAPATGTHLAGYVEKYVPRNFPDKFVLKQRWVGSFVVRNAPTAGTPAPVQYILFNTNSIRQMYGATSGVLCDRASTTRPNQYTNWSAQFGYYRVTEFDYKLTCTNLCNAFQIQTASPPGAFTTSVASSDALLTLMKTQAATDFSQCQQEELWEQKLAHNVVLTQRAGGTTASQHVFSGTVCPEDYDIDPVTTAGDETWTVVTANPTQARYIGLSVQPLTSYSTAGLLPEVGVSVFAELQVTVQYGGYLPALRQAIS